MFTDCKMKCPHCGHIEPEVMPTGYKEKEYCCKSCKTLLKAQEGECCVYCAYSNMICPAQQEKRNCCSD